MFKAQVFGTIAYSVIIIFNLIILYKIRTSKLQVKFDLVTKITINQKNIKILIVRSVINVLLMAIIIFSIWILQPIFCSIINIIFIINEGITRCRLYNLN